MDDFPKQSKKTLGAFLGGLVLIGLLGLADYYTGDFSFDAFYLAAIFGITWFAGAGCGLLCVLEAVLMEAIADHYSHADRAITIMHVWNWASDLLVFGVFCILVGIIRRKMSEKS